MYKTTRAPKTLMKVNNSTEGERIEIKCARITKNREPIKDGAPIIHTERKDGVLPEYNIRTDRFELAVEGMDYVHRSHLAKRDERHNPKTEEKPANPAGNDGKPEPTGATS